MEILCGIVTHCPDKLKIRVCIDSIINQVNQVLIVDNTPSRLTFLVEYAAKKNIELKINGENKGIAEALQYIMDYAVENKYSHVLTLDQDSVAKENLIEKYNRYWKKVPDDVGALTCAYEDKNTGINELYGEVHSIDYCITSGFLISTEAYQHTMGYDPWLFIDRVDWDICYLLKESGYQIYCIPEIGIAHEIGTGKDVYPLGKHLIVSNHVPWRRYYMARNGIYLARKHPLYGSLGHALKKELLIVAVVFIYENKKIEKLWCGIKGILVGMIAPINVGEK